MIKRLMVLPILYLTLVSGGQAIEVEQAVFEAFTDQVKQVCHTEANYDINLNIDEIQPYYDERMACLFSGATQTFFADANEGFQVHLERLQSDYQLSSVESVGEGCFSDIVAAQVSQGYDSLCQVSGNGAATEASLCQVAETAWNEFCAYQEYVYFKQREEILIQSCEEAGGLLNERQQCLLRQQQQLNSNLALSKKVLTETLHRYQSNTEAWAHHGWLVVITEVLENTNRRLDIIRRALVKWPNKFLNAASQAAGSMRRQ